VKFRVPAVPPEVVTDTACVPSVAPDAMVKFAVMVEAFTTVTCDTVTPVPLTATLAPETKFVPVKVTAAAVPCLPLEGDIETRDGVPALTVKFTVPEVPPEVVTDTVRAPSVAPDAMVKFAVMVEALTTLTCDTVTPVPLTATVAPDTKFVPVNVTAVAVPCLPLVVEIDASDGVALTVKLMVPEVPPEVVTDTVRAPSVAPDAMMKFAVMVEALTTVTWDTVTPLPLTATVAPEAKFVPVNVTVAVLPCVPLEGDSDTSDGVALTVKFTLPEVPPEVVTDRARAPSVAPDAMVRFAVMVEAFTTVTCDTLTPVPLTATVAPATKFVPVNVTAAAVPCFPLEGDIDTSVGVVAL